MNDQPEDDKYVVLKQEDWNSLREEYHMDLLTEDMPIKDAVVIRRQDAFAGPALHVYASMIAMMASFLPPGKPKGALLKVADYFHRQAVAADEVHAAGDSKWPD